MDSKYYTPSIEEFYVGFEYEYNIQQGYRSEWYNSIFDADFYSGAILGEEYETIFESIKNNHIRVKYLDKSDIESCGFKQVVEPWMDGRNYMYFKCTLPSILDGDEDYLLYNVSTKEITIGSLISYEECYIVSDITIKNLSELRKLLKQLGIDENK